MAPHPRHPGVEVRTVLGDDGRQRDVFTVRWREADGSKPRRSFDSLQDALDFRAKRRSAKRWRPEELRQERAGRKPLAVFFEEWWLDHAMVELARSTLVTYRCLWEAHACDRLGAVPIGDIDARRVVRFRGDLLAAGVGRTSVTKTMSLLQRVFRDAVEYGEVAFNPFKAVQKPAAPPAREACPMTPMQVEALAADIDARGYAASAVLVRLMAYTGMRPQEALALQWRSVGSATVLVELANTDGEFARLKNRKRSRKRSRSIDLRKPVREDLASWRAHQQPTESDLVFPHQERGGLWSGEEYRTWRRRIYVPSAENVELPSRRPYDLRHTWASLLIAEKRLSIAEVAEQLGDKTSTVLDVYTHTIREWRHRRDIDIDREIRRGRKRPVTRR